jgi:hypothetical protein
MLSLEQFTEYIKAMQASDKAYDAVSDAGIDLWKFKEIYCLPTHILTKAVFEEDQLDTIEWWLYDCPKGITGKVLKKHAIIWMDNKPKWRLYTIEALHSYLMELENPQ